MAGEFVEVRKDITTFLTSLRRLVDLPFRGKARMAEGERERFMRTMMMVEEARIRFTTYISAREEPTKGEWDAALEGLLSFVNAFLHSDFIDPAVYDQPFIIMPIMSRDRENPSAFIRTLSDRDNRLSLSEALIRFKGYLEEYRCRTARSARGSNPKRSRSYCASSASSACPF